MAVRLVPIKYTPGIHRVALRALCGHDEMAVETGNLGAMELLEQLLEPIPGDTEALDNPSSLATADRDRLLAAVYQDAFRGSIASTITCAACNSLYDLNFSLDALIESLGAETPLEGVEQLEDGTYRLHGGPRFRLPTGADELTVLGLPPAEAEQRLLERCLLEGDPERDAVRVQEAMQAVAPLLDTELSAPCPECGHTQTVRFNMQSFLLTALQQEQPQLAWEIHRIASAYHWSLREILDLSRRQRRRFVRIIEAELEPASYG